jgi:predicted dithiol-disulfide oxidoreductase (DUF899 family)
MDLTRLKESDQYRCQREELRVAELDLMDQVERVAALRRKLPADTVVDDYELTDVASGDRVRLSGLFSAPDRALVLYHLMYGKAQTEPCPMCTMWIDGYNAVAPHLTQNVDFAVVAAAQPADLSAHAASRGWSNLRLLSAGDSTLKYDLGSEETDGTQTEWISVFTRAGDGTVRHVYSKGAQMADERRERGIDLLSPVWHLLDLTPHGRGEWYPALTY